MLALALLALAFAAPATACDVCAPLSVLEGPVAQVVVGAAGASAGGCACEWVHQYSAGPTLGKARAALADDAAGAMATVTIFDGLDTRDAVATFGRAPIPTTAFSRTGILRVALTTPATTPSLSVAPLLVVNLTAVNEAPELAERDDLLLSPPPQPYIMVPWNTEQPLPVVVRDYDNDNAGLEARLLLESSRGVGMTVAFRVPEVPGVEFVVGSPDEIHPEIVLRGPGDNVQLALDFARMVPTNLRNTDFASLLISVSDLGNSGEGDGPLQSTYRASVSPSISGDIHVSPENGTISTGWATTPDNSVGTFLVHDTHTITFLAWLFQVPNEDGTCPDYLRVFDGPSVATGELLSTERFETGEICGFANTFLPTYTSRTGQFAIEFATDDNINSAELSIAMEPIPDGFVAWILDGTAEIEVTADAAVPLPTIMVTGPPNPLAVELRIAAERGRVQLEFPESFPDIIDSTETTDLVLSLADPERPAMLRLGKALDQLEYRTNGFSGVDTITVTASSGGVVSVAATLRVRVTAVSINMPAEISAHAFGLVPLDVALVFAGVESVAVSTASGIGRLSVDPRARRWVDVGYGRNVTLVGTASEVNSVLAHLVYQASDGGTDAVTVLTSSGASRTSVIAVNPNCEGSHIVYKRTGTFTERAGPPGDPFDPRFTCTWQIAAARLTFPFWEIPVSTSVNIFDTDQSGTVLFVSLFSAPPPLLSPNRLFFVLFDPLGGPGGGLVGSFGPAGDLDDPPLVVFLEDQRRVVRGTSVRLVELLYIDDFGTSDVSVAIETDRGVLDSNTDSEPGRVIEYSGASFAELDAVLSSVSFQTAGVQGIATVTASAQDEAGGVSRATLVIQVLPCDGLVEIAIDATDAASAQTFSDGSGIDNYTPGLACSWRLLGAPAPAVLDVELLNMQPGAGTSAGCADGITVFDGTSADGRLIGTYCSRAALGGVPIVSESGAFFVFAFSDDDGVENDGFQVTYQTMATGAPVGLGAPPATSDPERTGATVMALDDETVVVVFGFNGVRPLVAPMIYGAVNGVWQAAASLSAGSGTPSRRQGAAGAVIGDGVFLIHGGLDRDGVTLEDTWRGTVRVDEGVIAWESVATGGPATASGALHAVDDVFWLVTDAGSLWTFDGAWHFRSSAPLVATRTSALDAPNGIVYTATHALTTSNLAWTRLPASPPGPCETERCAGAMLGAEYALLDDAGAVHVLNTTTLEWITLDGARRAPGQGDVAAVGTASFFGRPAAFLYGDGALEVLSLGLGVGEVSPRVSPIVGGTVLTVSGEQFGSRCGNARCRLVTESGAVDLAATVVSERELLCTTQTGTATGPATLSVVCDTTQRRGEQYRVAEPVFVFDGPGIASVSPATPRAGETILVELTGVSADALEAVDEPQCLFDGTDLVAGQFDDEQRVLCLVPLDAEAGSSLALQIGLDGQQVTGVAATIEVGASGGSGGGGDTVLVVGVAVGVSVTVLVAVVAVLRHRFRSRVNALSGPAPWEIKFEMLQLGQVIGTGSFGLVYRGIFRGSDVAIKMTKDENVASIEAFRKESALMAELRHPNIVLFMGACTTPPNIAIVLEFMVMGSLFDLIHDEDFVLQGPVVYRFCLDIVKGMAYLHAADPPIVHRDLKSLNVLVDANRTLKVSDFGLTDIFVERGEDIPGASASGDAGVGGSETGNGSISSADGGGGGAGAIGSVYWSPPEVLRGLGPGDKAGDVYAFAVVVWEILSRDIPFDGDGPQLVMWRVANEPHCRPLVTDEMQLAHPELVAVMEQCWAGTAEDRPSFDDLRGRIEEIRPDAGSQYEHGSSFLSGSTAAVSSGVLCAVALQTPRVAALWEWSPMFVRDVLDVYHGVVMQAAEQHRGVWHNAQTIVFPTALAGVRFAIQLQSALLAAAWPEPLDHDLLRPEYTADSVLVFRGLRVAVAVVPGLLHMRKDSAIDRGRYSGEATGEASAAVQGVQGGQILVAPAAWDEGFDAAMAGGVLLDGFVYPSGLRDRHECLETAASRPEVGAPGWVIPRREIEIGHLIGAGSFGTAYTGTWHGTAVVCKQLHRKKLGRKETLDLEMEVGVAHQLRHPNVVQFLGLVRDGGDGGDSKIYVVTEHVARGSLWDAVVVAKRDISALIKAKIARDVALGLRYLHERDPPVVHRALSSRNVLLAKDWTAKVSDFGMARTKSGAATMTKVGSTAYSAPELLRGERYDEKVDVYAFGIVVAELVGQRKAFRKMNAGLLAAAVVSGVRPELPPELPPALAQLGDLATTCWASDRLLRPTMLDLSEQLEEVVTKARRK